MDKDALIIEAFEAIRSGMEEVYDKLEYLNQTDWYGDLYKSCKRLESITETLKGVLHEENAHKNDSG